MKRILAGAVGVAMVILFTLFGVSSPAFAGQWTETHCHNHGVTTPFGGYTVTLCVEVLYHTQSDGTGVTISDYWEDVNNSCGNLDSPAIKNQSLNTYNESAGKIVDIAPSDGGVWNDDCHAHHSGMVLVGKDAGPTLVNIDAEENLNNASNYTEHFSFHICDGGSC